MWRLRSLAGLPWRLLAYLRTGVAAQAPGAPSRCPAYQPGPATGACRSEGRRYCHRCARLDPRLAGRGGYNRWPR